MLGVAARAALVWPFDAAAVPLATAAINIVGACALGIVVGALGTRHPSARAFLGTGILGGFTTYSAFAVQVATLAPVAPWLALLIAAVSLIAGVAGAGLGLWVGRRLGHRPGAPDAPAEAE
ncbi:CrcB family protein [Microbacterium rhizomatis]|uniref:Fluoride-specific ion channel FluC n=2 Tax=Microbacterium rhizomatis TaxID=1631477 RepID=A0A5J5J188_9MICO|nr:CrcB family protein [Microbacterium rhizomatis]